MNAPTSPGDWKNDQPAAGLGHNNPPAFDQSVVDGFDERISDFLEVTQTWLDLEEVTDEQQAGLLTDQIDGLRGLYKEVDIARKAAKKPHDDAGKAVQAAFTPLLTKLKMSADKLKPKLEAYATKRAREEEQRKQRELAEAEARRKEAEAKAKAAEASGDIGAQVDAQEAAEQAEKDAKEAAKAPDTKVRSATGAGRTMALRTVKEVEITNINVLFMHYSDEPKIAELLTSLATAEVRAKGYDHASAPVPGIKIHEVKKVA